MSPIQFIDKPQKRDIEDYDSAIKMMVDRLSVIDGVKSIYQVGSVSTLGISDIDMFVVFDNEFKLDTDPVRDHKADTYLFTHQLYGISEKYWDGLNNLTFFHNYKLLSGSEMPKSHTSLLEIDELNLKRQIAMEFLVKMYLVLTMQLQYKIIKLRSFLLEGKALIYDLDFLNIRNGELLEVVNEIIDMRKSWFEKKYSDRKLESIISEVYLQLGILLENQLEKKPLYLQTKSECKFSRNVYLTNSTSLNVKHKGIRIPGLGILSGRKHFNLLHRFNRFDITFPYDVPASRSIESKLFKFLTEVSSYNAQYLPFFLIPASSLKVI